MSTRIILLLSAMLPLSAGAGQSSLMLGLGAGYGAEYEGSDKSETTVLPLINWEWQRDESCAGGVKLHRASAGVEGIGAAFWCAGRAAVTVNGGYDLGRDSGDSDYLSGLPDVDGGASIGLGFQFGDEEEGGEEWQQQEGGLGFEFGVATVDGDLVANAGVSYPLFGFLEAGIGVNYTDKGRTQKYFGVIGNNNSAAGTKLGECGVVAADNDNYQGMDYCSEIGGGIQSWSVSLETFIPLPFGGGESWAVNIGVEHIALTGDAADSPLVRDKSSTEVYAAVVWFRER